MNFSIKIFVVFCLGILSQLTFAQNISNVDANQEGKAIAITYDLENKSNISLYITYDGRNQEKIPTEFLSGDIGKGVRSGKERKILWRVLDQYPKQNFHGENISFIVKGKLAMKPFVIINGAYSLDSDFMFGITVGQLGQFGWYAKGMMTPSIPQRAEFNCDADGLVGDIMPAYSGRSNTFKGYGIGGASVRLGVPLYLYAGVGYGSRQLCWETSNNKWVNNLSGSCSGLVVDAGIMTTIKGFILTAGATSLQSKIDINLGVGYAF